MEQKFEEFDAVKRRVYLQAFYDFAITHDYRDGHAFIADAVHLFRWDRGDYRGRFMLNVEEWCRENAPHFEKRHIRVGQMTTVLWYRFYDENEAFAFKMRWC